MGLRMVPASKCTSSNTMLRIQRIGTCWFHAAVNGWLLSERGRELLKVMLREYKKTHKLANNNTGACPMRGKLPLGYFWHYIEFMLKPAKTRGVSNLVMNAPVTDFVQFNNNTTRKFFSGKTVREALNMYPDSTVNLNTYNKVRNKLKTVLTTASRTPQNFLNTHLVRNTGMRNLGNWSKPITLANVLNAFSVKPNVRNQLRNLGVNSLNKLTANKLAQIEAKGLNVNNLKNYMKDPNAFRQAVITSVENKRASGGSFRDAILLCRLLFGANYKSNNLNSKALVVSTFFSPSPNVPVQKFLELDGVRYLLSHAHISISSPQAGAHAITGFVCEGSSYLADSNKPYVLEFDWMNSPSPGPVINRYAVESYNMSFQPAYSVLFYIREDATQFVPEINTLGVRRNLVQKFATLERKVLLATNFRTLNNARRELQEFPNKNSPLARSLNRTIKEEMNTWARAWAANIASPNKNVTSLRQLLNKFSKAPYINHKEFDIVRNQALRSYQNKVRALVNNAIAGGNRGNMAIFINKFKNDPHPVMRNAVARLRPYLNVNNSPKPGCFGRFCRQKKY